MNFLLIIFVLTQSIVTIKSNSFDKNFINQITIENDGKSGTVGIQMDQPKSVLNKKSSVEKTKVDKLSGIFKKSFNRVKQKSKKVDVVFLIDSSSSVGKANFLSELKFVKKLLSDLTVSFNTTRVSVITFSSQTKVVSSRKNKSSTV